MNPVFFHNVDKQKNTTGRLVRKIIKIEVFYA